MIGMNQDRPLGQGKIGLTNRPESEETGNNDKWETDDSSEELEDPDIEVAIIMTTDNENRSQMTYRVPFRLDLKKIEWNLNAEPLKWLLKVFCDH